MRLINQLTGYHKRKIIFSLIIFSAFILIKHLYSSIYGVPPGYTGAPLDGVTCATMSCHQGPVTPVQGWITTDIPSGGYLPGDTYQIALTASRASTQTFGFLLTSHGQYGTEGSFIITDPLETQYSQGPEYITHRPAGTSGVNSKTWHAQWVAPTDTYTTRVNFYAATVAGAFDIDDEVFVTTLPAFSALLPIGEAEKNHGIILSPNPFRDRVNITSQNPLTGKIDIDLYQTNGALLKRWSKAVFADRHIYLDTRHLTPGVYYFRVSVEQKLFTVKMIKK